MSPKQVSLFTATAILFLLLTGLVAYATSINPQVAALVAAIRSQTNALAPAGGNLDWYFWSVVIFTEFCLALMISIVGTVDLNKFGPWPFLFWIVVYSLLLFAFVWAAQQGYVSPEVRRGLWQIGQFIGAISPLPHAWGLPFFMIFVIIMPLAAVSAAKQKQFVPRLTGFTVGFITSLAFDERNVLRAMGGEFWLFGLWLLVPFSVAIWAMLGIRWKLILIYPEMRFYLVGTCLAQFIAIYMIYSPAFGVRAYPVSAAGAAATAVLTTGAAFLIYWFTFKFVNPVLNPK